MSYSASKPARSSADEGSRLTSRDTSTVYEQAPHSARTLTTGQTTHNPRQPVCADYITGRGHTLQFGNIASVRTPTGRTCTALDISTGPAHFSDRRASTFFLPLARTGHLDICRATRFKIVLARTMTNQCILFVRAPVPHLGSFRAVFLLQRDASMSRVGGGHVNQTH